MKLTDISGDLNEWFNGTGPMSDVVISSRIRLARNLAGHKFLCRCSDAEKREILDKLREVILGLDLGEKVFYVSVDSAADLERNLLVERHLISKHHAFGKGPRGAVIAQRECFTAMINEEDHLRLQTLRSGLGLSGCFERINRIDDMIEAKVDYAFSPRYGYLTACPTNLGTGIRVSVMLHLPALKLTGHIEKFLNAAKSMNLAVRGLFGEGSEAAGDFYQLSNQVTLGVSESELVKGFESWIIPEIVEYEMEARNYLLREKSELLDDKISRSLALLKSAHLISSQEALFLLSHLRLGINMHDNLGADTPAIRELGLLRTKDAGSISIGVVNKLFMLTLPAHLQLNCGRSLEPADRDALRARIIRQALKTES